MAAVDTAGGLRIALLGVVAALSISVLAPASAARRAEPIGADCSQPERCLPHNQLRYRELLRENILQHWHPPASVAADSTCTLDLRQAPGGRVLAVQAVDPCDLDAAGRSSLLAAVHAAQPLPYEGYEQVFQRQLRLYLRAEVPDDADDSRVKRWWRRLRER
jgi:hypothetical protein